MALIKCESLGFRYAYNYIFQDLNFEVERSSSYAIIGPSGGGKTTLLKCCAGLLDPSSGSLKINYKNPGMIFQDDRLFPWLTIEQNLKLPLSKKSSLKNPDIDLEQMLDEVFLSPEILSWYPKDLSGGMRQRIAFLRALIHSPDILFLDEPFSALDFSLRDLLGQKLRDYLDQRSIAAVFITHDVSDALKLCDHIAILSTDAKNLFWLDDLPPRKERTDEYLTRYIQDFSSRESILKMFLKDPLV